MPAEDAGSVYSEVRIRLDKLASDINQAVSVMDRFGQKVVDTANVASNLFSNSYSKSIKQVESYVKSLDKAVSDGALTQRQAIQGALEARKAEMAYIQATAAKKGGYTDQEISDLKRVKTQIETLTAEQKKLGEETTRNASGLKALGLAASTAIIATFRAMTVETLAYSSALSDVRAASRGTAEELAQLTKAADESGKTLGASSTEALKAEEALLKAGITVADIMSGALPGALTLAAAGTMDVADAAEIAAATMTQFGLGGKDVTHIADLLAAGAGKAQGEVSDLSQALKQAGLVASQTGLKVEDTVGTLAAFASAGLLGSDAGTSFRTMLLRLTPQSKEAADKMAELGLNAFDAKGEFIGITKFAGQLQTQLKDLTTEERNAALATIFGSDSIRAANVLYAQGAKGIEEWISKVNDSGFAAETARIKLDSLAGDVQKLNAQASTTAAKIGSSLNPVMRGLAQAGTSVLDVLSKAPEWLSAGTTAALALAAGIGAITLGVGFLTPALAFLGITVSAAFGPIMLTVGAIAAFTGGVVAATAAVNDLRTADAKKTFGDIANGTKVSADEVEKFAKKASDAEVFLRQMGIEGRANSSNFKQLAKDLGLTNDELARIALRSTKIDDATKKLAMSFFDAEAQAKRLSDKATEAGKGLLSAWLAAQETADKTIPKFKTLSDEIAYQNYLVSVGAKTEEEALREKISLRDKEISRIEESGAITGKLSDTQKSRILELIGYNQDNQASLDAQKKKTEDVKKATEEIENAEKRRADEQKKNMAIILNLSKTDEDRINENRKTLLDANDAATQSEEDRAKNRIAINKDADEKIVKIREDAQAKIDAQNNKAIQDQKNAQKGLVDFTFNTFSSLASALGNLFQQLSDNELRTLEEAYTAKRDMLEKSQTEEMDALDQEYARKKELLENDGKTKKQVLEEGLATAIATGDAEAIKKAQTALDIYTTDQKYAADKKALDEQQAAEKAALEKQYMHEKAQLEYEAAMTSWRLQLAMTIASAAQAALNAWSSTAAIPVIGPGLATAAAVAAGVIGGIQIAAVTAAMPQPPKFATGGIVLPQNAGAGTPVTMGDGGGGDIAFGTGAMGKPLMNAFMDEVANRVTSNVLSAIASIGKPVIFAVDGKAMAEVVVKYVDNGVVKMRSIVK